MPPSAPTGLSAPDGRLIYVHARTAGTLYQTTLRSELGRSLGVRFGPGTRGQAESRELGLSVQLPDGSSESIEFGLIKAHHR
jgi:hypothetical protein